jgi:hypothetical protein
LIVERDRKLIKMSFFKFILVVVGKEAKNRKELEKGSFLWMDS